MPVLLAVAGEAVDLEPLFAAARERAIRVGWLELDSDALPPPSLAGAPLSGAFRVVAIGNLRSIAVKAMKGPPVLRDVLREHFLGADVVLVRGLDLFPQLIREGDAWRLRESAARERRMSLEELLTRLRKPAMRWRREAEPTHDG